MSRHTEDVTKPLPSSLLYDLSYRTDASSIYQVLIEYGAWPEDLEYAA